MTVMVFAQIFGDKLEAKFKFLKLCTRLNEICFSWKRN